MYAAHSKIITNIKYNTCLVMGHALVSLDTFFFLWLQLQLLLLEPDFLLAGAIKKKICSKNMCNYFLLKAFFLKMEVKVDEALQRKGSVTILSTM